MEKEQQAATQQKECTQSKLLCKLEQLKQRYELIEGTPCLCIDRRTDEIEVDSLVSRLLDYVNGPMTLGLIGDVWYKRISLRGWLSWPDAPALSSAVSTLDDGRKVTHLRIIPKTTRRYHADIQVLNTIGGQLSKHPDVPGYQRYRVETTGKQGSRVVYGRTEITDGPGLFQYLEQADDYVEWLGPYDPVSMCGLEPLSHWMTCLDDDDDDNDASSDDEPVARRYRLHRDNATDHVDDADSGWLQQLPPTLSCSDATKPIVQRIATCKSCADAAGHVYEPASADYCICYCCGNTVPISLAARNAHVSDK